MANELFLGLVLAVVFTGWGLYRGGCRRLRTHGIHLLALRWFTGREMDGRRQTDAGWRRPGVRVLNAHGHALRWHHWPYQRRAGIRTGGTAGALALLSGLATRPLLTLWVLASLLVTSLAMAAWLTFRYVSGIKHRNTYLVPLHLAAHKLVGLPRAKRAASWITYDAELKKVLLKLPPGWPADDEDMDRLRKIAVRKLGIENPKFTPKLGGQTPTLMIEQGAAVPDMVRFDDVRQYIEARKPGEIVLGLGQAKVPVSWHVTKSAHAGISAETGAGKSGSMRGIIAQHLEQGGIVVIFDAPKRFSHQWCKGLPNVAYARTAEESAALLDWLKKEADQRNEVADLEADLEGEVLVPFIPIMFVVEEANALMGRIRAWWRDMGGVGQPKALGALDELMFVGRQIKFRGLFAGQRLSARATSNADLRENINLLMLMNPSKSAWDMLAKRFPQPPPDSTKGRAQVVTDKVQACQLLWLTGAEARSFAMSGKVTVCPLDMPFRGAVSGPRRALPGGSDQPFVPETRPFVPAAPDRVTLSEAVKLGIAPVSMAVARKRPQRDEAHPRPVGKRGTADEFDSVKLADYYEVNP